MATRPNLNDIVRDVVGRLDNNNLVVQRDGDSGDSAYRSSIFAFLMNILSHKQAHEYYLLMRQSLEPERGVFRRTADPKHWGCNPNNLSRDQAAAIMLSATINGDDLTVEEFYKKCHDRPELLEVPKYGKKLRFANKYLRIGFHQNVHPGTDCTDDFRKAPDIIGIGEVRNEIRRKRQWFKYPLLCLLDCGFLVDLHLRKKQSWDFDSLYAKDLIFANLRMPTPFSKLAARLYSKTNYISCIRNNYADNNNGIEPLGELYEFACRKFINNED